MTSTEQIYKWRKNDCEAFQKWRRRMRCARILRGIKRRERVTIDVKIEMIRKGLL